MKKYTIKKGNHYSGLHLGLVWSDVLEFDVRFNDTAKYKTLTEENQFDINKLLGFSDYNSFHHKNSARFGWRWVNDELQLHAYCYSDGKRVSKFLTNIELHVTYRLKITLTDNFYEFNVESKRNVLIERKSNNTWGIKYKLYPYFGGDETPHHNIDIFIKEF